MPVPTTARRLGPALLASMLAAMPGAAAAQPLPVILLEAEGGTVRVIGRVVNDRGGPLEASMEVAHGDAAGAATRSAQRVTVPAGSDPVTVGTVALGGRPGASLVATLTLSRDGRIVARAEAVLYPDRD